VVKSKLVLVELGEDSTYVKVSISLNLGLLKSGFNSQSTLEEVEGGSHLADSTVVTSHVVVGHSLS
tara:strand:- start:751 stop:948 length:198 start_codon:yes stop_codon:yes gene_type:complete